MMFFRFSWSLSRIECYHVPEMLTRISENGSTEGQEFQNDELWDTPCQALLRIPGALFSTLAARRSSLLGFISSISRLSPSINLLYTTQRLRLYLASWANLSTACRISTKLPPLVSS